jgi:hypothetical protein
MLGVGAQSLKPGISFWQDKIKKVDRQKAFVQKVGIVSVILMLTSGCVVVGGYSSERGWYLWPGTIVIFLVFAVLFILLRRRR